MQYKQRSNNGDTELPRRVCRYLLPLLFPYISMKRFEEGLVLRKLTTRGDPAIAAGERV